MKKYSKSLALINKSKHVKKRKKLKKDAILEKLRLLQMQLNQFSYKLNDLIDTIAPNNNYDEDYDVYGTLP